MSYQVLLFSSDVNGGVVAIDSWVALESSSLLIDVVVVLVLTGSSDSLVLSRDMLHGSMLFRIQLLSGFVGRMWILVNLDMLDPKNTFLLLGGGRTCCSVIIDMVKPKYMFLSLEGIHILCNCLMNLRSLPFITSYPADWPRVISSLVVSSHRLKISAIKNFLSAMCLSHSWDLEEAPLLRTE